MTIDNLTCDILLHVFSHLNVIDKTKAMTVNRRFFYLLTYVSSQVATAEIVVTTSLSSSQHRQKQASSSDDNMDKNKECSSKRPRRTRANKTTTPATTGQPQSQSSTPLSQNHHNHNDDDEENPLLILCRNHFEDIPDPTLKQQLSSTTNIDVTHDALLSISSPPNLLICHGSHDISENGQIISHWKKYVDNSLPPSTTVMYVESLGSIQSNVNDCVESVSYFNCLMASFPHTVVAPILLKQHLYAKENDDALMESTRRMLAQAYDEHKQSHDATTPPNNNPLPPNYDAHFWKLFILNVAGQDASYRIERYVSQLQKTFPAALIVGGICATGGVTRHYSTITTSHRNKNNNNNNNNPSLQLTNDGIVGIAMGGTDVPTRAVVSRGVRGVASSLGRAYRVTESELVYPRDDKHPQHRDDDDDDDDDGGDDDISSTATPVHLVSRVTAEGDDDDDTPATTTTSLDVNEFVMRLRGWSRRGASFMGYEPREDEGFVVGHCARTRNGLVFDADQYGYYGGSSSERESSSSTSSSSSLVGCRIDLFELYDQVGDVTRTMKRLDEELRSNRRELLGAVMFSCNGRGPSPNGMMGHDRSMADAVAFRRFFPNVPLVGYYAGGEIGPKLMALADGGSVFRRGSVAVQGFTVVFLGIIVPVRERKVGFDVEDGEVVVEEYVRRWMMGRR